MSRKRRKAKLRVHPDPILTQICDPVSPDDDYKAIIQDMLYVLTNSKTGVGLAAPQAGHAKRIIAISPTGFPQILINPVITWKTKHTETFTEGCLSYPNTKKPVKRAYGVTIDCLDEQMNECKKEYIGFPARIIQHEIDHLNGKCILGETK